MNEENLPCLDGCDRLYFSPLAWLKLQWFCHAGQTEVGGFGISSAHNPLYIEEFQTLPQHATALTVRFDDTAVADYFDAAVDQGLKPDRFARVWLHTHPGKSAEPSSVDERTFARRFGACDWSVMAILSRSSQTYARLAFAAGPGAQVEIPVSVHWSDWPKEACQIDAALIDRWKHEYAAHVNAAPFDPRPQPSETTHSNESGQEWWEAEPLTDRFDLVHYEPVQIEEDYGPFC